MAEEQGTPKTLWLHLRSFLPLVLDPYVQCERMTIIKSVKNNISLVENLVSVGSKNQQLVRIHTPIQFS